MLSDNMLPDNMIVHGSKNKLAENMLADNIMLSYKIVLSDNMLSYFLKTSHTHRYRRV
jgi:hypothetical protein